MRVGDRAEVRRSFLQADLEEFEALSGCTTREEVPGPLLAALVSYLLGVRLPGPGTNYLKQELAYPAPAPLAVEILASVEVTRLRPESRLVDLRARCALENGTVVCEGRSLVKAPPGAALG